MREWVSRVCGDCECWIKATAGDTLMAKGLIVPNSFGDCRQGPPSVFVEKLETGLMVKAITTRLPASNPACSLFVDATPKPKQIDRLL